MSELICKCGCPWSEHGPNRACKKSQKLGTIHCARFELVTPTLEKMRGIRDESQAIGAFLEWLGNEQHLTLCKLNKYDEFCPTVYGTEKLLALYFDIDLDESEREKRQLLEHMRLLNGAA